MALIADVVFDQGLEVAQSGITRLDICSSEPANYAGIAAVSLGNKTGLTTGAPQNGATTGRRVIIPAIASGAPGNVTASGTATHWAASDGSAVLYATGALTSSQSVTSGNTWTLDAISLTIADAT